MKKKVSLIFYFQFKTNRNEKWVFSLPYFLITKQDLSWSHPHSPRCTYFLRQTNSFPRICVASVIINYSWIRYYSTSQSFISLMKRIWFCVCFEHFIWTWPENFHYFRMRNLWLWFPPGFCLQHIYNKKMIVKLKPDHVSVIFSFEASKFYAEIYLNERTLILSPFHCGRAS